MGILAPFFMNLFKSGDFTSHSGKKLKWKIECDALTADALECLAKMIADRVKFDNVYGVPRGGIELQTRLEKYTHIREFHDTALIVDDVLTTGKSMEDMRAKVQKSASGYSNIIGVVIFARGKCPEWITPIFQLNEVFEK